MKCDNLRLFPPPLSLFTFLPPPLYLYSWGVYFKTQASHDKAWSSNFNAKALHPCMVCVMGGGDRMLEVWIHARLLGFSSCSCARCSGTGFCPDCFLSHCFRYQWGMRFSYSSLVLEVKQSCLEENGRGLFHILIWSNPSTIPRAICTGNRKYIRVQLSCCGSQGRSVLSDRGSSPVCDPGTPELVLQELGRAYKWQFALLARLPGLASQHGCSSSQKQQHCVQNKPGSPHSGLLASLRFPAV